MSFMVLNLVQIDTHLSGVSQQATWVCCVGSGRAKEVHIPETSELLGIFL